MTVTRSERRPARLRSSRTDEVQQRIKHLILERGLRAGDPLPTEFELVEELDVSRNSLREALKAMQAVGIVEIRHGFGMYVGRMSLGGLVDELTFHGRMSLQNGFEALGHLVEVREILERGLVEQVIDRGLDINGPALTDALDSMAVEINATGVSPDTDRLFHELLYQPLANPIVDQLLSAFWEVYHGLQDVLPAPQESPQSVLERHRDIYSAVAASNRQAASDAMRAHFDGIRARIALPGLIRHPRGRLNAAQPARDFGRPAGADDG